MTHESPGDPACVVDKVGVVSAPAKKEVLAGVAKDEVRTGSTKRDVVTAAHEHAVVAAISVRKIVVTARHDLVSPRSFRLVLVFEQNFQYFALSRKRLVL